MPALLILFSALLVLTGCSADTVGKCVPTAADFAALSEHKSMVIHPLGCYSAWEQTSSPEAERLALLACSETNTDTDTRCRVVATDDAICPRNMESWIKEQLENKRTGSTATRCEFEKTLEVKSAPGSKPLPVDTWANIATDKVAAFFGLEGYDLRSSETIAFGGTSASRSNWIETEALHLVTRQDGKQTCVLRVSNGWDPTTRYFETVFRVHVLGCFGA